MIARFALFGGPHLIAMTASFVVPVAAAATIRPRGRPNFDRLLRWSFAVLMIVNWFAWMFLLYKKGWLGPGNEFPLNLCDWATVATVATLLYPNQRSYELAYFWALAGTLQGMMTPDVMYEYPDIEFILFFVFHGGIIASVLYLTLGLGWRPYPASLPRVIGWSLFYAAVAGFFDWVLGANYAFLRAKPPFATIFNFMPEWPWYIPVLIVLGLLSTVIYYAPFFVWDRIRASHSTHAAKSQTVGFS
ncbi:MAG: YwaF family protein [Rhizomicrobium sp.]